MNNFQHDKLGTRKGFHLRKGGVSRPLRLGNFMHDRHSSPRRTGLLTHRRLYLLVAPLAVLLLTVASAVGQTVTGTISANPTSVLVALGQTQGGTSISFSSTPATECQVYSQTDGRPEVLFVQAPNGTNLSVPWIQAGSVYDFNLYQGTNHTKLLATVRVTGTRGTISANPWTDVIIPVGQKSGTTTVTFSAPGAAQAQVYAQAVGGREQLFAQTPSKSATAAFIQDGVAYDFNLYEGTNHTNLLATVRVFGRKYAYNVGVDYHATGADFALSSFLADYHVASVRRAVRAQLQSMADRGATLMSTRMWLVSTNPVALNEKWKWVFPPSAQELANLRQYAQDVAAIKAADGHRLTLDVCLLPQWASDYTQGTPASTLGQENLAPQDFLNKWVASYQGVINAVCDVTRPDGTKVAGRVYLSGEVMIGAKANEDWFFTKVYPGFVSYAQGKGVTPTTYFNVAGREAEILDNVFTDGAYPILNRHRSMYWIYRSLRFFKDHGLFIPDRIDFSAYPQQGSASYSTLVQRIFDDADATLTSVGARKWYAVAETYYFADQAKRQELGNAFMTQRSVNNRVSQVSFWTTPDAGGMGVHIGFPFAVEDYLPPLKQSNLLAPPVTQEK